MSGPRSSHVDGGRGIPRHRKDRVGQGWSKGSRDLLAAAQAVVESLRPFWPLTARQIHYRLVAVGALENSQARYKALVRLLDKARFQGLIPWEAIEDLGRTIQSSIGESVLRVNVDEGLRDHLHRNRPDPQAGQDTVLEVWVEKDTVSRALHDAAYEFGVPVYVCKDCTSSSFARPVKERFQHARRHGSSLHVLYFCDLKLSGWDIPESIRPVLATSLGMYSSFSIERCALMPEHIGLLALPTKPPAGEKVDSLTRRFVDEFEWQAVELEALPPEVLRAIVRERIMANLNLVTFERERLRGLPASEWLAPGDPFLGHGMITNLDTLGDGDV